MELETRAISGRSPWLWVVVFIAALFLVVVAALTWAPSYLSDQLDEASFTVRLASVTPSLGCVALLAETGGGVLDTLAEVAKGVAPKGVLPNEESEDHKVVDESARGGEHAVLDPAKGAETKVEGDREAPPCSVSIDVVAVVENPLFVGVDVQIERVEASVASVKLRPEDIVIAPGPVHTSPGQRAVLRVGLGLSSRQLFVAAGGALMARRIRVEASVVIRVTGLGGWIEETRAMKMSRALTISDIIRGVDGTVGARQPN